MEATSRKVVPLELQPVLVATLIDEEMFLQSGGNLTLSRSVFLEDRFHDWDWDAGKFSYYTRVVDRADVVVVYELAHSA